MDYLVVARVNVLLVMVYKLFISSCGQLDKGSHQILDPYFELLLGPSLDDGVATNLSREKGQLLWDASVCQPLKPTI